MIPRRYDLACVVDPYRDGWTVERFLAHRFRYQAPAVWATRIAEGAVRVNGETARADLVVHRGDRIEYVLWHAEPDVDFALTVLHEDEHVLAVSKSGNLPVHAGGKYIRNTLIARLRETYGPELRLAHRLDRETSGVVLLAKTRDAARSLEREFAARRVDKVYVAIVRGEFPESLDVDAPIAREDETGASSFRRVDPVSGKPARTVFRRLAIASAPPSSPVLAGPLSLVLARPVSGRTNQIRVHAAWVGHPILGDKIYGVPREVAWTFVREGETPAVRAAAGAARHLLHCQGLSLRHPGGGTLRLSAPLPPDFEGAWGRPLEAFAVSWPGNDADFPRAPTAPAPPSEGPLT